MIKPCIDFYIIPGPYSATRWYMLHVFGMEFTEGVLISVN